MVGGVPAFQLGGPGSIPCGDGNFNVYPGTGCQSIVFVLFCDCSGGGPDIVLAKHSGEARCLMFWSMGGSSGELSEELVT